MNKIICGNALELLKEIEDKSVDAVIVPAVRPQEREPKAQQKSMSTVAIRSFTE